MRYALPTADSASGDEPPRKSIRDFANRLAGSLLTISVGFGVILFLDTQLVDGQRLEHRFSTRGGQEWGGQEWGGQERASQKQEPTTEIDRVELEVVFDPRAVPRDGALWAQMLSEVGFDRAILRKATGQDEIGIQTKTHDGKTTLQVTGGLHRERLLLPGLEARLVDRNRIANWLLHLKTPPTAAKTQNAFGLSDEELVQVQQLLAKPIQASTSLQDPSKTWEVLQTTSPILLIPTLQSAGAISQESKEENGRSQELKGVSVGTALAAFGRPYGLVLVPGKSSSGNFQLSLLPSSEPAEYWPIGWPTKKALIDLAPTMLQRTDVDLRGQTLSEAFRLISLRTEIPILLDYNSLIAKRIPPEQTITQVRLRDKTWRSVMTAIAVERRPSLQIEARIDDAGSPFFWVSRP